MGNRVCGSGRRVVCQGRRSVADGIEKEKDAEDAGHCDGKPQHVGLRSCQVDHVGLLFCCSEYMQYGWSDGNEKLMRRVDGLFVLMITFDDFDDFAELG